ncbi:protein virilizer homolog isoform X2 [Pocillopora verrucosa]|uniref:protein virilizer homolog isoform X2 n=1 Tax=Pocillopora verrucosa TaxID=203993 RepID=UPI0033407670
MAAMSPEAVDPVLLFCDTFSHPENEEMHLDLISFPRPVCIQEVRVIPAGHRVHAAVSEREKMGETHPPSFKLDLFIRNLDRPADVVFERLGQLEYKEPNNFQLVTNSKGATDVVVLRGWYNRITISLYGLFTDVNQRPQETRAEPRVDRPPVIVETRGLDRDIERVLRDTEKVPFEKVPERAERDHDRGPERSLRRERSAERGPSDSALFEKSPDERAFERTTESKEKRDEQWHAKEERKAGKERERTQSKSPPRIKSPPGSPESAMATVGESTAAKPTTPPGSPREEQPAGTESGNQSPDDLFEPLTPDRSPSNLFMSDEEDIDEPDGYEEILSDEEEMDDGTIDDADVQFGDLDLYSEDAWMSVSVSFNPYQCDLSPLTTFSPPDGTEYESALLKVKDDSSSLDEQQLNLGQTLFEHVEMCCTSERNKKWIEQLEEIPRLLIPGLAFLTRSEQKEGVKRKLIEWILYSLDVEMAQKLPIAANIRLLKAGLKLVGAMCSCGSEVSSFLIEAGVQESLGKLLTTEHMSSSMKLLTLQAIDNTTDSYIGMEHFLGWDEDAKVKESEENTVKEESKSYQQLVDFLLADQTVRVVESASALARKVHLYELLALLQKTVDKIIETTPSPRQTDPETDSVGEVTETKHAADVMSPDPDIAMDTSGLASGEREQPLNTEMIEILASTLEEICIYLKQAQQLIVQAPVKAFPTSAKITGFDKSPKDPYPVLFHFFKARRLLESILVVMSSTAGCHPAVFGPIRDFFFTLLQSQQGLLFLSSHPDTINGLIRVLTQTTEADIHHSDAAPLNEILRDTTAADSCTPQHLGLLLIYHLQTLQAVDQLLTSLTPDLLPNDMDGADLLSTLHTLYSMTFTAIGKAAVVSVLSLETNLSALLPFVESTGDAKDDAKLKKCVSTRYATVLILLTVKLSENVEMLSKLAPRLTAVTERVDADSSITELGHWLVALKDIKFDMSGIGKLVEFVKSHLDEMNVTPSVASGVLMAVRVLRYLACPVEKSNTTEVIQKDLNHNLACIELFSANAMDVFINVFQKLGDFLLRPWRQGQPLHTGPPLVMVSMVTPLLALVKTLLIELLNSGKYQFKDRRLMKAMMVLHTVMCTAPMTGQLSSLAHKVQSEIVDVFMTFTRPVVQSSDHEEAINESIWSLMLKELLEYTTSAPQAFLGGLVLLSELLPIPLPIRSLEEMPQEEANLVMNHRRLWSAHLNPLSTELQGILKDLAGSACHNLQQVLRRVCSQLSDLSAPTAFNIVRTLLETLDSEMSKASGDDNSCSPGGVRIMTLLAYLSSQPAVKVSLLQLLKTSGNAKNDDLLFPSLLPSMLSCLKGSSENQTVSRSQYCVVSIVQSLCDPTVSLMPFETPFTDQHLANTLPDKEMLEVICAALLEHMGSEQQSFATILLALRTLLTLTEHNYGVYHQKRALENNSEVFYRLLKRLSSSFENSIPGPDHLSTLSTTIELLQLLLPEDTAGIIQEQEDDAMEGEPLKLTTEISISAAQMRSFLKFDSAAEDGPLRTLEKRLEESCKEDEALEPLLDAVRVLTVMLRKTEGETEKEAEEVTEPQLPSPLPLQTLFVNRLAFVSGEVEDGGVSPTLWYSTPLPDDIDPEVDLIKIGVDSLTEKFSPDFDLKAELEKGLVPSPPGSPTRKKAHRNKRKYDPLISGQRKDNKKARTAPSAPMRGGGRGTRGMPRGRGNPRMNDLFRSRKQNTSRPPSMHVDDFMAMENAKTQDSPPPMRRTGPKGPPPGRSMDHGPGNFMGNQGRWTAMPGGPLRKGPGMVTQGGMRGAGPDWGNPRQHPIAFPGQRNFQRGPDWGSQTPQPYRGGGGGMRNNYNRPQMRGYWDAPKSKDDSRFMPPPNVGGYRPGAGRGYPGRHMRSFTR